MYIHILNIFLLCRRNSYTYLQFCVLCKYINITILWNVDKLNIISITSFLVTRASSTCSYDYIISDITSISPQHEAAEGAPCGDHVTRTSRLLWYAKKMYGCCHRIVVSLELWLTKSTYNHHLCGSGQSAEQPRIGAHRRVALWHSKIKIELVL